MNNETLEDTIRDKYVIFLFEGTNEEAIIKWLSEEKLLLLDEGFYKIQDGRIRGRDKRKQYMKHCCELDYKRDVIFIYVNDSPKEKLAPLGGAYKTPIYYLRTPPEIEILFVHFLDCHEEYKKSDHNKPSCFCKEKLGFDVKSKDAVKKIFEGDIKNLITALNIHKSHNKNGNYFTMADIIKK